MQTIPAREIKRHGISVIDKAIKEGPVHVTRHDRPLYVIMGEDYYRELVEAQNAAYVAGVRAALEDVSAGRTRRLTAENIIAEFDLDG